LVFFLSGFIAFFSKPSLDVSVLDADPSITITLNPECQTWRVVVDRDGTESVDESRRMYSLGDVFTGCAYAYPVVYIFMLFMDV